MLKYILPFLLLVSMSACGSSRTNSTTSSAPTSTPSAVYADISWKKLVARAEKAETEGDSAKAAELYRAAWEKKQNKPELLFKSAELYSSIRDYRNAADAYQYLLPHSEDYPLVGLKLARAQKQDGQYDRAQRTLARFLESYNEADRPIIEEMVTVELAGIEMAQRQAGQVSSLKIKRPETGINSEDDEYSPIPGDVGQLFFGSNRGDQSRIYETRQQGRDWGPAAAPAGFPVITEGEFGSGSISPDGERFYFTICSGTVGADLLARCEIFLSNRTPTGWGQPTKLPEYINTPGVNNMHPHVTLVNGREILYFSSDRTGGRGGLDLWYTARNLGLTDGEFSYPANLGPSINTLGDEITPFYNAQELALYFSSNGHPGLGGQDVFKASGQDMNWGRPENQGLPISSVADDYGFVVDRIGSGDGYLVSNRAFGGIKNNTTETDIFQVNLNTGQILLKASAYDNQAGTQLNDITVTLFQIFPDGQEEQLTQRQFPSGAYLFELIPNQRFRVEVTRTGYQPASYTLTTDLEGVTTYGQPLFMVAASTTPATSQDNQPKYPNTGNNDTTYPSAGNYPPPTTNPGPPPGGNDLATPTPPAVNNPRGRYYKVQISAVKAFDSNEGKYQSVKGFGNLESEPIPGRDLQRITVGPYLTEAEAKAAMTQIQESGFPSAFTVRYDDGVRYGRVNL